LVEIINKAKFIELKNPRQRRGFFYVQY